eukprot:1815200-Prorocentrum_lima.AAC.1
MTSSLVGSEMCIRDSHGAAEAWPPACAERHRRSACRARAGQRGTTAVSYTHLTLPTICSV